MLQNNRKIAKRVPRLITVATPHYGSPVADAVLNPLFPWLPSPIQGLTSLFSGDAGALADLQTRPTLHAADDPHVDYLCVGCDMAETNPRSPVFALTSALGGSIQRRTTALLASTLHPKLGIQMHFFRRGQSTTAVQLDGQQAGWERKHNRLRQRLPVITLNDT